MVLESATFGHKNRRAYPHLGMWAQAPGWRPLQGPHSSPPSTSLPLLVSNIVPSHPQEVGYCHVVFIGAEEFDGMATVISEQKLSRTLHYVL